MIKRKKVNKRKSFQIEMRHRINAGRVALTRQFDFFEKYLGATTSEWKEDDTRVTFADYAISEKIFMELRKSFASDCYLSEESNPLDEVIALDADFSWILDPIDGTNNYFHGIPICAISLALLHEGVPVYGFIYDLSRKKLIEGGPGHGVSDGGKKVKMGEYSIDGNQNIVGLHFPMKGSDLVALQPFLERTRVRCLGSAALNIAFTAIGKMQGVIDLKVRIWDIAAGYALIGASEGSFYFESEQPVLPLKEFSMKSEPLRLYCGNQVFCEHVQSLLQKV